MSLLLSILGECGSTLPTPTPTKVASVSSGELFCEWQEIAGDERDVDVWFILDRSHSMFGKAISESQRINLYAMPNLFILAGKRMNQALGTPRFRFSLHLAGPHTRVFPIEEPSAVTETLRWVEEGEAPINGYEIALGVVFGEMKAAPQGERKVLLLLTDGAYTENPPPNYDEETNVRVSLKEIESINGAEVYVVLLPTDKERLPWRSFQEENLVTGIYEFPEGLTDLARKVFPPIKGKIQTNWFSGSEAFQLPGWFSKPHFYVATLGESRFAIESPNISPSPWLLLTSKHPDLGLWEGNIEGNIELSIHRMSNPSSIPITLTAQGAPLLGFCEITESQHPIATVEIESAINDWPGTLTVTMKRELPNFTIELTPTSEVTVTVRDLNNGGAQIDWKPIRNKEPQEIEVRVLLRGPDEGLLNCGTITLPVKFQPIPYPHSSSDCSGGFSVCTSKFVFQYNPPRQNPTICLWSATPPPTSVEETPPCNTPFPDEQSLECPTPRSVSDGYCVTPDYVTPDCVTPVSETNAIPTASRPIVAWCEGTTDIYTYTIRMPRCYLEHCRYEKILFTWKDSPVSVPVEVGWKRDGERWELLK